MDLIKEVFKTLWGLNPTDLSVIMFVFLVVDLWSALSLTIKKKTFLSKTFIRGLFYNLVIIVAPFGLDIVAHFTESGRGGAPVDYVQFLSLVMVLLYCSASATSIIANYTAAYPEADNLITKFGYRFLPQEIRIKLEKHENKK